MGMSAMLRSVAMVVVLVGMAASLAEAEQDCANKLVPCYKYLNSTTKPPAECCDPIKETVANQLDCLCNLYNTPGFLASLGLNITQALHLTQSCGVPVESAQCSNATASSPESLPPPPGVPGGGNGSGAQMIVWSGISPLLIFLASMMFY